MVQDLTVIHRRKPRMFTETGLLVWSTCLRSLAVLSGPPIHDLLPDDEVFVRGEAYRFLAEIACGLHSPIVGETEVFGQFKSFADQWSEADRGRRPLIQRLLNDVKSLRSQYLVQTGAQSYGSWLRKNLRTDRVHVIGGGQLAREILPYLCKQGDVVLHVRAPEKVDFHSQVRALSAREFDGGALIVAAPLRARDIAEWLAPVRPSQVFDLRADSHIDSLSPESVSLQSIFADLESAKSRLLPVVERIKLEINTRAEQLAASEKVRPQGWDDLCA